MNKITAPLSPFLVLFLALVAGCGIPSAPQPIPAPLNAANVNLIFVASEDSANTTGDVNPDTANLTNRRLQRSLLMAPFLTQIVLGGKNVTGIYALEPMTHMQVAAKGTYPDMVPLEIIEQFALLNQITLPPGNQGFTANSYPILASYSAESIPAGVAPLQFNSFFTFSSAYSLQGPMASSLAQLYPELATSVATQALYRGQFDSGNETLMPGTITPWNAITDANWPVFRCGIGNALQQDFANCVNSQ
jgi:hypothetical protein